MKKLGKYGKKVSCVVIGMLCAAAIGACGSTQSGSQDEKDVRNDISVYEEGADLEGTLTYGTLFIEPQTQHMIDLVSNHQFNWWFIISPPKGYCYYSPQRAVSQALLLARYKAVLLESSRLDSSACSFIYF